MDSRPVLNRAITHLKRSVELSGGYGRFRAELGEALLLHGNVAVGVEHLRASHASHPRPRTAYLLSLGLFQLGHLAEAEEIVGDALVQSRAFDRAAAHRARVRAVRGDVDGAIADLRGAHRARPQQLEHRIDLATLLLIAAERDPAMRSARLSDALEILDCDTVPKKDAERVAYVRGCALLAAGEVRPALAALQRTTWPSAYEVSFRRGLCHFMLANFQLARPMLEHGLAINERATDARAFLDLLVRGIQPDPAVHRPPAPHRETGLPDWLVLTETFAQSGAFVAEGANHPKTEALQFEDIDPVELEFREGTT